MLANVESRMKDRFFKKPTQLPAWINLSMQQRWRLLDTKDFCAIGWKIERLCKKSLERVWSSIGARDALHADHRPNALSIARQLALSYQKQDFRLGTPGLFAATKLLDKAEYLY